MLKSLITNRYTSLVSGIVCLGSG